MKMTNIKKTLYISLLFFAPVTLGSCIDEETPMDRATETQLENNTKSPEMLVSGLPSAMIAFETNYKSSENYSYRGTWWATQDWGYPCYMYVRDTMLDGFPYTDNQWNYQMYYEAATGLSLYSRCPFYFYYSLINNTNAVLNLDKEKTGEATIKYYGIAHTYRALAYMDLSMMFEFYKTGYGELDQKANDVIGLTVPIKPEKTTDAEAKDNPRAPFYTMYRFIYNDLASAEEELKNASRTEKNEVNIDVINGLMARFWLNLATRFRLSAEDLTLQLQHENDNDGYRSLGITSADDCYRLADKYAQKVINAGYTPLSEDQWHNTSSGFNSANQSWIWCMRYSSIEQITEFYASFIGTIASEPTWAFPSQYKAYRCIGKALYDKIQDGDWRKTSWIDPEDAGKTEAPKQYKTLLTGTGNKNFSMLPEYANIKFRPASGNLDDSNVGMLVDIPLMRVEEMYFIQIEAALYLESEGAAKTKLESFLTTYRFSNGQYRSNAVGANKFIDELVAQKYIEFWGEGIMYNDYKRLRLKIDRTYEGTNYIDPYKLVSRNDYVAPWLNFYIPQEEKSYNKGIIMNPDPTAYVQQYCKK
ncbi:MAG: hypothetical protein ACI4V5_01335 [Prevotella sp.]